MSQEVERYRKPTRVLHWVHAGAFILLFLTGLVLFVPGLGVIAQDSWSRVIHRIAAAIFIIAPLIYIPMNWKSTKEGVKSAFSWASSDIGWLKAAPRFYFLGDKSTMPPQGHMNTGQKMWWFLVIIFGTAFVITGLIMWFGKTALAPSVLLWTVFLHDIAFIVTGVMLFVHIYLGVLHPLMTESWRAMAKGKISSEYAKTHHAKWYEEVTKGKGVES